MFYALQTIWNFRLARDWWTHIFYCCATPQKDCNKFLFYCSFRLSTASYFVWYMSEIFYVAWIHVVYKFSGIVVGLWLLFCKQTSDGPNPLICIFFNYLAGIREKVSLMVYFYFAEARILMNFQRRVNEMFVRMRWSD